MRTANQHAFLRAETSLERVCFVGFDNDVYTAYVRAVAGLTIS